MVRLPCLSPRTCADSRRKVSAELGDGEGEEGRTQGAGRCCKGTLCLPRGEGGLLRIPSPPACKLHALWLHQWFPGGGLGFCSWDIWQHLETRLCLQNRGAAGDERAKARDAAQCPHTQASPSLGGNRLAQHQLWRDAGRQQASCWGVHILAGRMVAMLPQISPGTRVSSAWLESAFLFISFCVLVFHLQHCSVVQFASFSHSCFCFPPR